MSKERRFGLTKYRLGKDLADYKQSKINKKQRGLPYIEKQDLVKATRRKKVKADYCPRLKGEHDFVLIKDHSGPDYFLGGFRVYSCSACGKLKHEIGFKKDK